MEKQYVAHLKQKWQNILFKKGSDKTIGTTKKIINKKIDKYENYSWHTVGKTCSSLRSPWISITKTWLVTFKLGLVLEMHFGMIFGLAWFLLSLCCYLVVWACSPSVWDGVGPLGPDILFRSIVVCRLPKDEEIIDFQILIDRVLSIRVSKNLDPHLWSLEVSRVFSVKSFVNHLSPFFPFR